METRVYCVARNKSRAGIDQFRGGPHNARHWDIILHGNTTANPFSGELMQKCQAGFTVIELAIITTLVCVLQALVLPSYGKYMARARLTEAQSALSATALKLEQLRANTGSFRVLDGKDVDPQLMPAPSENFTYALENANSTGYLLVATGHGPAAGLKYTLNQSGARATTGVPAGWTRSDTCWVARKDGSCSP